MTNTFIFRFLGGARVNFTPTPLNLKRFFPTLLFLNKLMILKKKYQASRETLLPTSLQVPSENRGHGLICGFSIPLSDG